MGKFEPKAAPWNGERLITFGGKKLPAFSHPIESTGASSEDLIRRMSSRTSLQLAGGSTVTYQIDSSFKREINYIGSWIMQNS